MSELRQDPVTGVSTIVAPERAGRPKDFSRPNEETADASGCPFCPGHEHMTPPTTLALTLPGREGWTIRVFANKYPALQASCDEAADLRPLRAPGPYRGQPGSGAHEVVVETPEHAGTLAGYSPEHAALLADAYADRLDHWRTDGRFAACVTFRNFGARAGASLAHPHTQMLALPRVPDTLVRELGNFTMAAGEGARCPLCAEIEADCADGRQIFDDGITVVFSSWAAPIPYHMRIAPRRCAPTLADADAPERASFGMALVAAARALRGVAGEVAFNLIVHDAPYSAQRAGLPFHWHAELFPRTSDHAGLELASGLFINPIDPDRAAEELRAGLERAG